MPHASPPPRRTTRGPDPLTGVHRLVVDVNNVVGALPRARTTLSATTLLGRLRAIVPSGGVVELVFDGPPARGTGRPGPGLVARYAGPRTADELILDLVRAAGIPAPGDDPSILVVTDDNELRRGVRDLGAATAGTAWLIRRAEATTVGLPSVGRSRPPASPAPEADEGRPGWRPGRGATAKHGNPRRTPRTRRHGGAGTAG
jgi:hypothetical protein